MSFCFNFSADETPKQETEPNLPTYESIEPAQEISVCAVTENYEEYGQQELVLPSGIVLHYLDPLEVEDWLRIEKESANSQGIHSALEANSDLVPHVYEGGLKLWECSIDLVNYLSSSAIAFRGLNILELGCGTALPGLLAYMQDAKVTFQDYNWEVLRYVTIPNVRLNTDDTTRCRFVSGDWAKVEEMMLSKWIKTPDDKYDMILTSETIYSPESYQKLLHLMECVLKPTGIIYLAAKTYYFGVGGGCRDFVEAVCKSKAFTVQVCKEFTEGVNREILMLKPSDAKNKIKSVDRESAINMEVYLESNMSSCTKHRSQMNANNQ